MQIGHPGRIVRKNLPGTLNGSSVVGFRTANNEAISARDGGCGWCLGRGARRLLCDGEW
jgi:hypothetical protein